MGMPMYGQSFSLADNQQNGLNAATYGGGEAGEETRARGFLAYYEVITITTPKPFLIITIPLLLDLFQHQKQRLESGS